MQLLSLKTRKCFVYFSFWFMFTEIIIQLHSAQMAWTQHCKKTQFEVFLYMLQIY